MALKVRTSHGKVFHRCGIRFDGNWKIIEDDILDQPFASPGPAEKGKHPPIGRILMDDPMLLCLPVDSQGYPVRPWAPSSDLKIGMDPGDGASGSPAGDSTSEPGAGEETGDEPSNSSGEKTGDAPDKGSKPDSQKGPGKGKGK